RPFPATRGGARPAPRRGRAERPASVPPARTRSTGRGSGLGCPYLGARHDARWREAQVATGTVLIVEDERELARVLTDYLRRDGYRVETAHDGQRGLELWRAARPDLILL